MCDIIMRDVDFSPALCCAPLAGLTHSAFRRLASEFGGCGAFWTEMLAAREVLKEDPKTSPWLKRSATEARLIYQLMVRKNDPVEQIVACLSAAGADGIDINLACHAPVIRNVAAGSGLFEDVAALSEILEAVRRCWPGLLTVKIRLGRDTPGWQARFEERIRLFENIGVDAIVLHPRFFEDKFKRRARHELLPWVSSLTRLPLIANGDIIGPETVELHPERFAPAKGLMIGRMAIAQPWIFAAWNHALEDSCSREEGDREAVHGARHSRRAAVPPAGEDRRPEAVSNPRSALKQAPCGASPQGNSHACEVVDHAEVWYRMSEYIRSDFTEKQALSRLKMFTRYYARNFKFGHHFNVAVHNAPTLEDAVAAARNFFDRSPEINPDPPLMGL